MWNFLALVSLFDPFGVFGALLPPLVNAFDLIEAGLAQGTLVFALRPLIDTIKAKLVFTAVDDGKFARFYFAHTDTASLDRSGFLLVRGIVIFAIRGWFLQLCSGWGLFSIAGFHFWCRRRGRRLSFPRGSRGGHRGGCHLRGNRYTTIVRTLSGPGCWSGGSGFLVVRSRPTNQRIERSDIRRLRRIGRNNV